MILGTDGEKMSKSRGNVINPDDVVNEHGAVRRLLLVFMIQHNSFISPNRPSFIRLSKKLLTSSHFYHRLFYHLLVFFVSFLHHLSPPMKFVIFLLSFVLLKDALRLYEMFMGPLEAVKPWQTNQLSGVVRFR